MGTASDPCSLWGRRFRLPACALLAVLAVSADAPPEVLQLLTRTASALAEDDLSKFLKGFDPAMPGYGQLRVSVETLLAQADVSSTVEIRGDSGGETQRDLDLDWFLEMISKYKDGPTGGRRQMIHCRIAKQGGQWKIVTLEPVSFFAPLIAP